MESALEVINDDSIKIIDIDYPVPHTIVPLLINSADVVVLTSFLEGSPNIIKEALACNSPIVSVDIGDVKENINGIDGCYISNYDSKDVSEKIQMAVKFGKKTKARNKIQHLELNNIAKQIINLYLSIN